MRYAVTTHFVWYVGFGCTLSLFFFLSDVLLNPFDSSSPSQMEPPNISFVEGVSWNLLFIMPMQIWSGVAVLDYNNDGWLDMFLHQWTLTSDALYHNNGDGTFTDLLSSVGVDSTKENGAVVAGDIDNDGDTDLVVGTSCSATAFDENGGFLLDGNLILYLSNGDGIFC